MKSAIALALLVLVAGCVSSETVESGEKSFDLKIENNILNLKPPLLQAKSGDMVTITISADETGQFHIHGYDEIADLVPGEEQTLVFEANLEGRYEVEFHKGEGHTEDEGHDHDGHDHGAIVLGAFEVLP